MAVNIFDQNSLMRIGTRQLALRGARKSGKPTMVIKRISRPSHTERWLAHAIHFAEVGHSIAGQGYTLEEVVARVAEGARESDGFKAETQRVQTARRQGKYAMADNNIASMKSELARTTAGGYGRGERVRVPATFPLQY